MCGSEPGWFACVRVCVRVCVAGPRLAFQPLLQRALDWCVVYIPCVRCRCSVHATVGLWGLTCSVAGRHRVTGLSSRLQRRCRSRIVSTSSQTPQVRTIRKESVAVRLGSSSQGGVAFAQMTGSCWKRTHPLWSEYFYSRCVVVVARCHGMKWDV